MRNGLRSCTMVVMLLVPAARASAQSWPAATDSNPATSSVHFLYGLAKRNIVEGAEKMPDAHFSYRPTPEVRTFGQLVAHIADAQYIFCSSARNEPNPNGANLEPGDVASTIEQTKTTKADLVAALKEAFAYCDPVFASVTDANWKDGVRLVGADRPKGTPLVLTIAHLWEHYGNMTTYLREKGIVPPSTERLQAGQRR